MNQSSFLSKIFLWKRFSSFTYLNATQFLVTLNDSIFRLLVAFSLIDKLGTDQSSTILFISGVLFVSPFLIFSMPAGELADKCSKQKVIIWTLVLEMLAMAYGVFAMIKCSVFNAFAALFCVALQASVFLPSKYAILPEIVSKDDISKANGYMTLATYLAIIFGTFLASFFTQITGESYVMVAIFCFILAALGLFTSLQIEKTEVKSPEKKINPLFLIQVYKSLKLAKQYPHLLLTVIASSYFLYTASFTQLNLIPFGIQSLKITDVQSGYVFLAAALGIGIGSTTVALISGKNVELGISIWGAFGTSLSYIILFLLSNNLIVAILMILSLGIHGGLYIVPLDAYVQIASPEKDRGEIVAASSFLGFVGVFLAALSLGFFSEVLHISAAHGYLIIGLLSLSVSIVITFLLPEYFSRILAVTLFKAFYHLSLIDQPKTDFYESVCIVCRKYSFLHILTLIYIYPRIAFIRFVKKKPFLISKLFYSIIHIVPIPVSNEEEFHAQLKVAVGKKMPLCFFLESYTRLQENDVYNQAIQKAFNELHIPILSLHIQKKEEIKQHSNIWSFVKILPVYAEAIFSQKSIDPISMEKAKALLSEAESKRTQ